MSDRYVFSQEEGLWIDTTKTFVDDDGETLYEEIDPWATMNDQDTHLNALRAELEQVRGERDAQTERHKAEIVKCLRAMDKLEAERDQLAAEGRVLREQLDKLLGDCATPWSPTTAMINAEIARVRLLEAVAEAADADRSAFVPANTWMTLEAGTVERVDYNEVSPDGPLMMALPVVSADWLQALDAALAAWREGNLAK